MNIFDTHAHYADRAFDDDRGQVLDELPGKGVKFVMLAASGLEDSVENMRLAQKYDYIYAAVGVHPENIDETPGDYLDRLRRMTASEPKIKAIGEIGLDYHYEGYDRDAQIRFFCEQLKLAAELDMPVIVHSRDASEDTVDILREYRPRGVVHCFSGSAETAKEILKLGMYIGFTGVLTFKNAKKALKALEAVPLDRLLMETDCPYMAPEPFRGKRSDSSMIAYTAAKAAEIKGITTQELIDITSKNGITMYEID
ncbi:MAG: TatD family hydrolase [Ruminococcus sp.]|uniref:TatD family hydrolase n=1 Tax=Ruminococcus sp. TaxID=41978 RepID=UPI001AFE1B3A|nr:TatD family hydrolase [Ruminococcus sp.]MBO7475000.1 TatD family hydrolase [Ruminococcus sp.]